MVHLYFNIIFKFSANMALACRSAPSLVCCSQVHWINWVNLKFIITLLLQDESSSYPGSWMDSSLDPGCIQGWIHPGIPLFISWLIVASFLEQIWRSECGEPVYWQYHCPCRPVDPVMHPNQSRCRKIRHVLCVGSLLVVRSVTDLSAAFCQREGVAPEHRNQTIEPRTLQPFSCLVPSSCLLKTVLTVLSSIVEFLQQEVTVEITKTLIANTSCVDRVHISQYYLHK